MPDGTDTTYREKAPAAPTSSAAAEPVPTPPGRQFRWSSLKDLLLVPPIIIALIVGWFVNEKFVSVDNLVNIMTTLAGISLIVLAQVFVLVVGKMDLSLESTFGLAPGIAIWLSVGTATSGGFAWASSSLAIPVALLVGAAVGVLNGLLIVKFGLNGFIVTLAMLIALRGLLTFVTGGFTLSKVPAEIKWIGTYRLFGEVPVSALICVLLFAGGYFVLEYTRLGRSLYAIGGNVKASKAAGIRTERVVWGVLIVAGLLAALGGLIYSGQFASVQVSQGDGMIFTVFAACVIGGVSLNGGRGSVVGAFLGIVLLTVIQKLLSFADVSADAINAINGTLILVALVITRLAGGKRQD